MSVSKPKGHPYIARRILAAVLNNPTAVAAFLSKKPLNANKDSPTVSMDSATKIVGGLKTRLAAYSNSVVLLDLVSALNSLVQPLANSYGLPRVLVRKAVLGRLKSFVNPD